MYVLILVHTYFFPLFVIFFSIRTEIDRELGGATSHMAIAQASLAHSGIYTCSVSDSISQSLRLHIIDGECSKCC